MESKQVPIGQLMVQLGYITSQQLNTALDYQKKHSGIRIGDALIALNMISEDDKLEVLSKRFNVPIYQGKEITVPKEIASLVPEKIAEKYQIMPLGIQNNSLQVATSDPLELDAFSEIKAACGLPIEIVLAHADMIGDAIRINYSQANVADALNKINETLQNSQNDNLASQALEDRVDSAPVVKFINNLIKQAYGLGASDIHIEPFAEYTLIRIRIDGILRKYTKLEARIHEGLITRLKIMGGMNIAEHRLPQDGRIDAEISGKLVDIRISSLPTIYGEKVVIRLLGHSLQKLDGLQDLGLDANNYQLMKRLIHNPYGLILVAGPTGSGKTTSLYACLDEVKSSEVNIVTVEDPVERKIEGINQVQVNPKAGLTFENGLRSILRQDPDIIMIGEIRDTQTAKIAVSSAITGHLVLSTIHTNDTATAINRLVDMGIEPYLLSSSILGIIAQRLVRKTCPHCREAYLPDASLKPILGDFEGPLYRAKGCPECNNFGYKGRTAVFEIMPIDNQMRIMIEEKRTANELKQHAIKQGMRTLGQNALDLVKSGQTTLEEYYRVIYNLNQ